MSRISIFLLALLAARILPAQPVVANGNGDFEAVPIGSPFISTDPNTVPGWTRSGSAGDGLLVGVGYSDQDGSVTVAGHGNQFAILEAGKPARPRLAGPRPSPGWRPTPPTCCRS